MTTRQKCIVDMHKMKRRDSKYTAMENHPFTKGDSKEEERNKGTTKKPENN